MNINYKKYLSIVTFLILIILMVCAAQAQTPTYDQWGMASPRFYHCDYGDWTTVASYYASLPTLSANDTFCLIGATQTLVGKTLTSPTLTTPTLTTPVITGVIDASDGLTVDPGAGIDVESAGILDLGDDTATTINIGGTAATTLNIGASGTLDRTFNIGCGASSDTFNIGTGGTVADDINIGDSLAVVDVSGSTVTLNATTLTLTGTTTNITGGSGSIDYDNFDVDSSGNVEASGQIHSDLYHWSDEFDYEASGVELGSGLQADFWTVSGTNDAAGMYLYTAGAGGTLDVSSCVAEDDSSAISGLANYRVNNDPIIEFRFKISDVSNCFAAVGFAEGSFDDKGTVDDDVCLVYIDYDSADTTPDLSWNVWCADTNVDVSGDLGVDATSDTYIIAKIDLTDTEQPRIWIDGTEISAALILGTVQAGTTLFPYAHVQTNYTAAKEIVIDYIETWQDR